MHGTTINTGYKSKWVRSCFSASIRAGYSTEPGHQ